MSTNTTLSPCEVHSVIKFLSAEVVNGCEVHQRLMNSENNVMLLWSIYPCIAMF